MESFHYVDLFATKGIEYILVISFLLLFIFYWKFLNKPIKARVSRTVNPGRTLNAWFILAKNYYFHQGHSWVMPEENNIVRVGIDDFAVKLLGKPDSFELPRIGSRLNQGETGWKIPA